MKTMNYKEAAGFLKITEGTLRNWVSKGRIKPHKVGKHVLFFREELETWITGQTPVTTPIEIPAPVANKTDLFIVPQLAVQPLAKPIAPAITSAPVEWVPQFNVTFSDKEKEPYVLLLNMPGKNVKMTPDNIRELARYLVDTASFCEQSQCRGRKNFPIFREFDRFRSSVCLVPFDQIRDLQTLALAALRSGDVLGTTKEKYVGQFIREGLQRQLPLINMQLTKKGMRRISFKSLRK